MMLFSSSPYKSVKKHIKEYPMFNYSDFSKKNEAKNTSSKN